MKELYNLITYPLSVIEDPIMDYIFISVIGAISFIVSWSIVGKTNFRGKAGSFLHWTIRIITMFIFCSITSSIIKLLDFIKNLSLDNWILIVISILIIISLIISIIYTRKKDVKNRKISKNKKDYFKIINNIINNYYYNKTNKFDKKEIVDNTEDIFILDEIILMLKKTNNIIDDKDLLFINYDSILILEKILNDHDNYVMACLAVWLAFVSLIVSLLLKINSIWSTIVIIILMVITLILINKMIPKN